MSGWDSRAVLPGFLRMGLLVALVSALALLAVGLLFCEGAEADLQESNVAIYLEEGDDGIGYASTYKDSTIWFNLTLENNNVSDTKDRYVLLYVIEEVERGDAVFWDFKFANPIEGYDQANFSYDDVDYYRYLVKGNGTPTKVEIEIDHYYVDESSMTDMMEYRIRAYDYKANTPSPENDNWTRFFEGMVAGEWSSPSNLSYLLDSRDHSLDLRDFGNETSLITLGDPYHPPHDFQIWTDASIQMALGETYNLSMSLFNEAHQRDKASLSFEFHGESTQYLTLVTSNYEPGTELVLDEWEERVILVEITADKELGPLPHRNFSLAITATPWNPRFATEKIVDITVHQRKAPNLQVVGEDDKNGRTDGNATSFDLRLKNTGALDDSFELFAEVQEREGGDGRAAGKTDDHWTKQFSQVPVFVRANSSVDLTLNITPLLDNEKIPPGKYPVKLWAVSQNDSEKVSEDEIIIRMPNLYNPSLVLDHFPSTVRVGLEAEILFTVKNDGLVEDRLNFSFVFRQGESDTMISPEGLSGWSYAFEDAGTGELLENDSVLLGTEEQTKSRQVRFIFTAPANAPLGDYGVTLMARSSGPVSDLHLSAWQFQPTFELLPPELYINKEDIVLSNNRPVEGELVTINVTVHLAGAVDRLVELRIHHVSAEEEELINIRTLNFMGQAGEDLNQTISVNWEASRLKGKDSLIDVRLDPDDTLLEENEDNNAARSQITVTEKEDSDGLDWGLIFVFLVIFSLSCGVVAFAFHWTQLRQEQWIQSLQARQRSSSPGPMKLSLRHPEMDRLIQELRTRKQELEKRQAENPKAEQSSQLEAVSASLERLQELKEAMDMIPRLTTLLFNKLGGGEAS